MDIAYKVMCKVDISQSEVCIAYASMVYECRNKHGLITYSDEYLPNQAIKVCIVVLQLIGLSFKRPQLMAGLNVMYGFFVDLTGNPWISW